MFGALRVKCFSEGGFDVFQNEPVLDTRILDLENGVLLPESGSPIAASTGGKGHRVVSNLNLLFSLG